MFRRWLHIVLILLMLAGQALAGEETTAEGEDVEPGREDMEIIAVMDVLELMDLVESMEMIKDMDVLIEEEQHENQD